jgi:hypothetical protein
MPRARRVQRPGEVLAGDVGGTGEPDHDRACTLARLHFDRGDGGSGVRFGRSDATLPVAGQRSSRSRNSATAGFKPSAATTASITRARSAKPGAAVGQFILRRILMSWTRAAGAAYGLAGGSGGGCCIPCLPHRLRETLAERRQMTPRGRRECARRTPPADRPLPHQSWQIALDLRIFGVIVNYNTTSSSASWRQS